MANKHVVNPCDNSGQPVLTDEIDKTKQVWKAPCELCGNKVTVSKKSMAFRKHSKDTK